MTQSRRTRRGVVTALAAGTAVGVLSACGGDSASPPAAKSAASGTVAAGTSIGATFSNAGMTVVTWSDHSNG